MFVKIATPGRNSQKLRKFIPYISDSNANKRSNLQKKKTERTSEISTLYVNHSERSDPVHVVALNHTGSLCNPGQSHSKRLRLAAKFPFLSCAQPAVRASHWPIESQTCSMGEIFGEYFGNGRSVTCCALLTACAVWQICARALFCWNIAPGMGRRRGKTSYSPLSLM